MVKELLLVHEPCKYFNNVQEVVAACSKNTVLEEVRLGRNFLPALSLEESEVLFETFGKLPSLHTFQLWNGTVHASALASFFQSARHLQTLELKTLELKGSSSDFFDLELALRRHPSLQEFSFKEVSCHVQDSERQTSVIEGILYTLASVPNLQVLKLHVKDQTMSASCLAPLLCRATHLREFHLHYITLSDLHYRIIAHALKSPNSPMRILSLSHVHADDKAASYLAEALQTKDNRLIELDLSWNEFTSQGCRAIAESIASHQQLSVLRLWGCKRIGPDGFAALAQALERNTVLQKVETPVGDDPAGRQKIYDHLQKNRTNHNRHAALAA